MLADVDELEKVRVDTRVRAGGPEGRLVRPRSARGDHDAVEPVLGDGGPEVRDAGFRAGVEVLAREDDVRQRRGVFRHGTGVQESGNVRAAVADEDAHPDFFHQLKLPLPEWFPCTGRPER